MCGNFAKLQNLRILELEVSSELISVTIIEHRTLVCVNCLPSDIENYLEVWLFVKFIFIN